MRKNGSRVLSLHTKLATVLAVLFCGPVLFTAKAAEGPILKKPDLPDLNVTHISRTPRYPGYVLKYQPLPGSGKERIPCVADPETGEALPMTGLEKNDKGEHVREKTRKSLPVQAIGADKIKRWPDEGEEVTFTAMVCNHGTRPTGKFDYVWYIDGKPAGKGTHDSLDGPSLVTSDFETVDIGGQPYKLSKRVEGTYCRLELKWKWKPGRHYVRLDLDPYDKIDEICEVNNGLMDATDACQFVIVVDAFTYNTLAERENHWKSYNFEDIIKYHREQMHRKFKTSISQFAPDGILEEIRYDAILVQAEGEKRDRIGRVKLKAGWDSHWDFTGYIQREKPSYKYFKHQDWGLPHELGHQLGLIDYYCLDTEGGDGGNLVKDENGDPVLLSHFTGMVGMMRGHGDIRYSSVSAAALNSQRGRRRGYYGDYLWSVPENNKVRILDFDGKPVPDAELKFYQHQGRYVQPDVVFKGKTDRNGEFTLPNRECLSFATDNGFTIRPNPWGQINVVGANGVFFIEVKARDYTDYTWLQIIDMNVEYLRGNTKEATYDLKTIIPGSDATRALDVKQVIHDRGKIELTWTPINEGEIYTVYQRVNHSPRWKIVDDAREFTEPSYKVIRLNGNGRFMVVAKHEGKVSAASREQRVVLLRNPMGITLDEKGRRIIRDSGYSMPVMFRNDNSTVGIFGTFHMGLGGAGDIARTSDGRLLVTESRRAPIRILDSKAFPTGKRSVGELVSGDAVDMDDMKFKGPTGITIDSKGRVWVCDTGHGRIQVLDKRLEKVLFKVGGEAGLKAPTKVVELSRKGLFAVSDSGAGKVIVLALDGNSVEAVDSVDVARPVYLAMGDGRLFVSDEGPDEKTPGQVLSFKVSGSKLTPSKTYTDGVGKPYGLAYDKKMNALAVVDRMNRRLVNIPLQ